MTMDLFQERGLAMADHRFGDQEECRFPLFDFLKPLPLQWMYVLYLVMLFGKIISLYLCKINVKLCMLLT